MTAQQVELSTGPDPGARFPGSTVDFSGTGDWSFPPAFPWSDTPPPGVTLRKKEDQSQEWRRAPSAACAVVADAPRRFADVSDAQLTLGGPGTTKDSPDGGGRHASNPTTMRTSHTVASGIRCKRDGRGSGFVVMLGGGTDIVGAGVVPGDGRGRCRLFRSIRGPASLVQLAGGRPGVRHRAHVPELVGVADRADRLNLPVE